MPKPFRELTILLDNEDIEIVTKSLERQRTVLARDIRHAKTSESTNLRDTLVRVNKLLTLLKK